MVKHLSDVQRNTLHSVYDLFVHYSDVHLNIHSKDEGTSEAQNYSPFRLLLIFSSSCMLQYQPTTDDWLTQLTAQRHYNLLLPSLACGHPFTSSFTQLCTYIPTRWRLDWKLDITWWFSNSTHCMTCTYLDHIFKY